MTHPLPAEHIDLTMVVVTVSRRSGNARQNATGKLWVLDRHQSGWFRRTSWRSPGGLPVTLCDRSAKDTVVAGPQVSGRQAKVRGGMKRIIITLPAGVLPGSAFSPIAANPGGGRSSIRIESLGMPLGEVGSRATAVDRSGIVVLGDAYWNAT